MLWNFGCVHVHYSHRHCPSDFRLREGIHFKVPTSNLPFIQ